MRELTNKPRKPVRQSKLAVALGLPPETPDNVIRGRALAYRGVNRAYRIAEEYLANNPPPAPLAGEKKTKE